MWDGDISTPFIHSDHTSSSKPTVWDGDKVFLFYELKDRPDRSKPTVWDGDLKVPPFSNPKPKPCSKPTVWDGDDG